MPGMGISQIAATRPTTSPPRLPEPDLRIAERTRERWDRAAQRVIHRPYLDPLVASAKRRAHLCLLDRWLPALADKSVLKTDLWEEGVAGDELLFSLATRARVAYGVDVSPIVVTAARQRAAELEVPVHVAQGDVLNLPFESGSLDVVVSTSTLDHLDDEEQHRAALAELRRVLARPGVLILTVDNRKNAFDWALRGAGALGLVPFPLGPAPRPEELLRLLEEAALRPGSLDYLVPAPRVVGTAAVRLARVLSPRRPESMVLALLRLFEALGRRAPERMGCFVAVRATAV